MDYSMNQQAQLHEDIRSGLEAHSKLPLKERLARLREIGILTADLQLSERYGGEPAKTSTAASPRASSRPTSK